MRRAMLPALSLNEAAALLNVHPNTLRGWCQEGRIEASKPGRDWRILPDEIERVLERSAANKPGRPIGKPDVVIPFAWQTLPLNFDERLGKKKRVG